jgi:predicted amidohydrolase YtcJ
VDAHFHLLNYCLDRERLDLRQADSVEALLAIVARGAGEAPPGTWLRGRGWDRNRWPDRALPTRDDLDRVAGGRAVCLVSRDAHATLANSLALKLAGVEPRESSSSLLLEGAGEPVRQLAERRPLAERVAALRRGQRELTRLGLTALHSFEGRAALRALRKLEATGELGLRVFAGVTREQLPAVGQAGLGTGFGSDRLRIGLLKLFADGALGSGTASLLEPYEDGQDGRGQMLLERDELVALLRQARQANLGVATHAIGDAAVRLVLDAAEAVRADDPAHRQILRIEHAQLVHPEDLPRFAALGVIASMQPVHATSDLKLADRRWGTRCRTGYAWRSLLDRGAHLAFGTDCPVESPDPLPSLYAAITRQHPDGNPPGGWYAEQRLTIGEAISAYTLGAAAAAGLSREHGSLAPGKLADLVVLSRDPYRIPPAELLETRVDLTIFDGLVVHGA